MNKNLLRSTTILSLMLSGLSFPAQAAIHNITGSNGTAANPYVIDVSYNGATDQIISSAGTVADKSYINVKEGVSFANTVYSGPSPSAQTQNLHGSVVYAYNSVINFGGNNVFSGNKFNSGRNTYGVIYAASPYRIGEYNKPQADYSNEITFGNNTLFENNSAVMGNVIVADASEGGKNVITFGDNTRFMENHTARNQVGNGGNAGVIMSAAYGTDDHITSNTFNFGNNTLFEGNRGVLGGVILTDLWAQDNAYVSNNFNFYGDVSFINNQATGSTRANSPEIPVPGANGTIADVNDPSADAVLPKATGFGGVIYSEVFGNDNSHSDNYFNFYGTTIFDGNQSQGIGGAIVFMSEKENEEFVNDIVNFAPQKPGQYVLFNNNTGGGQLNSFYINNTKLNFELQKNTYADIRDPIYAVGNSELNKTGEGGLYLWGDNSDFNGTMNINGGSLYAMFEEVQTPEQQTADPLGQRTSFSLGGKINFGPDTLFRPMMNQARTALAPLDMSNVTGASNAVLAPYEVSKLSPKDYIFNNNFENFKGFDTPLANLTVNGNTNVLLTIKRNLAGYQGLNESIEAYRNSDLDFINREMLDDIYITGQVSDEIKEMFEIAGGDDYISYNQIHRATVRQFDRQLYSRIHNRNQNGFLQDQNHFWLDASYNQIRKDRSHDQDGYKYDPQGFAAGYDFELIPGSLTTGIAGAYTTGRAKMLTGSLISDHNEVNNYLAAWYGKYQPSAFYAAWQIGGGYFKNKTRLLADSINARAKYHSKAFFANGETGYKYNFTAVDLEPYLGLEYTHIRNQAFTEQGVGGRRFDAASWDIFETPLGLRISYALDYKDFLLTPTADLAYAHNFGDTSVKTGAAFIGNAGQLWQVASDTDKRDSFRGIASLKFNHKHQPLALHLGYAIDYRSDYTDQQYFATLRYDF